MSAGMPTPTTSESNNITHPHHLTTVEQTTFSHNSVPVVPANTPIPDTEVIVYDDFVDEDAEFTDMITDFRLGGTYYYYVVGDDLVDAETIPIDDDDPDWHDEEDDTDDDLDGLSLLRLPRHMQIEIFNYQNLKQSETATKEEIENSGLEVVSPQKLEEYAKDEKVAPNCTEMCIICLDEYKTGDEVRVMKCKHAFHRECIDNWLERGWNNCPACRTTGVSTEAGAV